MARHRVGGGDEPRAAIYGAVPTAVPGGPGLLGGVAARAAEPADGGADGVPGRGDVCARGDCELCAVEGAADAAALPERARARAAVRRDRARPAEHVDDRVARGVPAAVRRVVVAEPGAGRRRGVDGGVDAGADDRRGDAAAGREGVPRVGAAVPAERRERPQSRCVRGRSRARAADGRARQGCRRSRRGCGRRCRR